MKKIIKKANTTWQKICIHGYVKGRHLIVGSTLITSISAHANGTTFGDMFDRAGEQANAGIKSGPIICWAIAFIIGMGAAWAIKKRNDEGPQSQSTYGKALVGFIAAAAMASIGFMIKTSANSIGIEATSF
ncbi:hypothetical protein ABLA30_03910 [Xenorhabdus nematophila]|uniref:hypothetical protein n=1 Tax=Xenorhabdus nematophila TaxID=628 RepID=UPI0032B826B6